MSSTAKAGEGQRGRNGRAAREDRYARARAIWAHVERCRALPRPGEAEVARLVAEFHARGGTVTLCPPACVLAVQNGTGLAAVPMPGRSAAE